MNLIISIITILPIFLIGFYYYQKDTQKEPKKLLSKLFISGFISGIIVIILSIVGILLFPNIDNNNNFFNMFCYTFIFIATIEELIKFLMIYIISYNNKEFDQAYDIIVYSVFVGIGFAFFETLTYLLINKLNILILLFRSLTAVPSHAAFQTLMGYFLSKSNFAN